MAARDFSAALSEQAVLQAIVRHMSQALEATGCTISAWDRGQDSVTSLNDHLSSDRSLAEQPGATYPLADYPATRWVLLTRQPRTEGWPAARAEQTVIATKAVAALG